MSNVYIAGADGSLRSALETLLEHSFSEEPQTQLRFRSVVPAKDCSSGWPRYRLRHGSRQDDVGILLIPSSLWHLDLNGMSLLSDTLLFPGSMCQFPRMEPYLNGEIKFRPLYLSSCITNPFPALIHTIVERESDVRLNPNLTRYILSEYSTLLPLLPAHRFSQLPIENQFFARFFDRMLLPKSRLKFFSLWQRVRDGSLNLSQAIVSLPRRDMRIVEIKARQAEKAGKSVDT